MNDTFKPLVEPPAGLITLTHVIYGLHAFSAASGLMSAAFVLTAFLTGWPSIIAVILSYMKRNEARGTWLESHNRWQIRTFWFALFWMLAAGLLALTLVGIPLAIAVVLAVGIWVIYRIVRGWVALTSERPMPL